MTKRILTEIHHHTEIDLENFVYTQMYVGTNGCTATINGTTGDFHPNTKMDLILRTLSNASGSNFIYGPSNSNSKYATQIWLMGDGAQDSYANGIRNHVDPTDQNYTKLQLNSMVSNDIQNVTISGLS